MNKKYFISGLLLFISIFSYAQVGIGTKQPKSTFDVTGKPTDATAVDGITAPRISGNQLKAKDALYGPEQAGTIVYATAAASPTSTKTAQVTVSGFYYFDGSVWKPIGNDINIYKNNGTITAGENRNVFVPDATNLNFNGQGGANIFSYTDFGELGLIAYEDFGRVSLATEGANGDISITTKGTDSDVLLQATSDAKNVGIGTQTPTNKLHVSSANPLRLEGLQNGATTDEILTVSSTGVVTKTSVEAFTNQNSLPTAAVFVLTSQMNNFLNGIGAGFSQTTPMTMIKNAIPGLTYNSSTSTITFPPGTYQMTYVYEANHNNTGCTISSYIVDFPAPDFLKRIHGTAAHNQGTNSVHGGSISYTTVLPSPLSWVIRLGRGVSGNCTGTGMNLAAPNTQFTVVRIGD